MSNHENAAGWSQIKKENSKKADDELSALFSFSFVFIINNTHPISPRFSYTYLINLL